MVCFCRRALLAPAVLALIGAAPMAQQPNKPAGEESDVQQVEIVLSNFSFTPSEVQLKAGQTVTLHFVNRGPGAHNFTATKFFASANMDPTTRAQLGNKGVVELAKGEQMDVTVTPKAGEYKAKCGHFLHATFGMTGSIKVS